MNAANYVKIALFFVVLGGAGAGYMVLSSSGIGKFNSRTYEVILEDATGLSTRSRIYLAGVPVGKVEAIELNGNEARLRVAFLKDVELRRDAVLTRKASSILGTSVLSLNPGTELTPLILPGGLIQSSPTEGGVGEALTMVEDIGSEFTLLLEEFRTNQMALLAVSLDTFNSIAQKIDTQSETQLDHISRILESAALISERTENLLRTGEGNIAGSVEDIRGAAANIRAISGEIAKGRGNIGQAVYDERLYESLLAGAEKTGDAARKLEEALANISTLAQNADNVVTNAGEVVNKALGLGISVDTSARYDILAKTVRAGASLRLDPASGSSWYRVGVTSTPDGVASRTLSSTTVDGGAPRREDTTETAYRPAIDAELARRWGPLTLRGGLLENSAGVGLDLEPLPWLGISGELFRFQNGEVPNLRSALTVYPFFDPHSDKPWNWLYLRGGINNALSGDRDYFFGGGLRFADREIKGLVGLAPAFN